MKTITPQIQKEIKLVCVFLLYFFCSLKLTTLNANNGRGYDFYKNNASLSWTVDNNSTEVPEYFRWWIDGGENQEYGNPYLLFSQTPLTSSRAAIFADGRNMLNFSNNSYNLYNRGARFVNGAGKTNTVLDAKENTGVELMRVNKEEKVDIGTSSPSKKLDVEGDINFTGDRYRGVIPNSELVVTTNISVWNNGNTERNVKAITDGNTETKGGINDYQVHPLDADGKNITFSIKSPYYYKHGMFVLYNRTECCKDRIKGSWVRFYYKNNVINEQQITSDEDSIVLLVPEDARFDKVSITFAGNVQNFREIQILGVRYTLDNRTFDDLNVNSINVNSINVNSININQPADAYQPANGQYKYHINYTSDALVGYRIGAAPVPEYNNSTKIAIELLTNDVIPHYNRAVEFISDPTYQRVDAFFNRNVYARESFAITDTDDVRLGLGAGGDLPKSTKGTHVFIGRDAGKKSGFEDIAVIDYSDNANTNPITGMEYLDKNSVFVLNNSSDLSKPLLFGNFASDNQSNSMAQLAINTHHVIDSVALTVSGAVHIGPKNLNPSLFPSKEGYEDALLWVERGIVTENVTYSYTSDWKNWPDYVFEEDYDLMKLNELETYIRKEKHLPGIISRDEVKKEGLKSKEMITTLLLKIEELTLYTIDQEKKLETQKQLNKTLLNRLSAIEKQLKSSN